MNAQARPFLDLNRYHFQHTYGDLTLFGSWVMPRENKPTPALVLIATRLIGTDRAIPCIVPLSSAWRWGEREGSPRWMAQATHTFAANLGLNAANAENCLRIASIVRENLGRLLAIPPQPTNRTVVADAFHTDLSGRVSHSEIIRHV